MFNPSLSENTQSSFVVDLRILRQITMGVIHDVVKEISCLNKRSCRMLCAFLTICNKRFCFVLQINGKHLDKIIAASVEKVTKKSGDKLKLHVARTIQARSRTCEVKVSISHWYQFANSSDCSPLISWGTIWVSFLQDHDSSLSA